MIVINFVINYMSSYIARFGNYRDSLYSDIDTDDIITNSINSNGILFDSLCTIDEKRHYENEETVYNDILDCYIFPNTPKKEKNTLEKEKNTLKKDISNKEKRKGIQVLKNQSKSKRLSIFKNVIKKSPINIPIQENKTFFRVHFDIINKTKNIRNNINTWKLKQEYKKKINNNIFCSTYNKEVKLYDELIDGTLMIMYKFESWNNYNGLFGGYKLINGEILIFYMYPDTINMFIDYLSEDSNKYYLKYLNKLQEKTSGYIYFKEKFNIKQVVTSKDELFTLIEDIKDGFFLRNFIK